MVKLSECDVVVSTLRLRVVSFVFHISIFKVRCLSFDCWGSTSGSRLSSFRFQILNFKFHTPLHGCNLPHAICPPSPITHRVRPDPWAYPSTLHCAGFPDHMGPPSPSAPCRSSGTLGPPCPVHTVPKSRAPWASPPPLHTVPEFQKPSASPPLHSVPELWAPWTHSPPLHAMPKLPLHDTWCQEFRSHVCTLPQNAPHHTTTCPPPLQNVLEFRTPMGPHCAQCRISRLLGPTFPHDRSSRPHGQTLRVSMCYS